MHIPVLLQESIEKLDVKKNGIYVDGTLGEAGHSKKILSLLDKNGTLLSIDKDTEAIEYVRSTTKEHEYKAKWIIEQGSFADLKKLLIKNRIEELDGIILDLGLSSRQIDQEQRGFSYKEDEQELDMRMDQTKAVKAKDLLMVLSEQELAKLFAKYGEERSAKKIAKLIKIEQEKGNKIEKVGQLRKIIYKALPIYSQHGKDPARRVFQALRIAVNDELNELKEVIATAKKVVKTGGSIVIISFHSLEDKIVKEEFGKESIKNLIEPTEEEIARNPRSKSAKMRWMYVND